MASIRRTDIMHKSFSKGRPAKTERERNKRRQEAYRWRDARRIYLANSFDKWRKLRSSLGMKDSGLAWHLMEAHEKGQCGICERNKETDESKERSITSLHQAREFLPSLISSIRSLCNSHFQFEDCIKIVGLLCLEFDNARKESYSLNETISVKSLSQAGCRDQSKSSAEVDSHLSLSSHIDNPKCQNTNNTFSEDNTFTQSTLFEVISRSSSDTHLNSDVVEGLVCLPESQEFSNENSDGKFHLSHGKGSTIQVLQQIPNPGEEDQIESFGSLDKLNCFEKGNKLTIRTEVDEEEASKGNENHPMTGDILESSECKRGLSQIDQNTQDVVEEDKHCDQPFLSVVHPSASKSESFSMSESESIVLPKPEPDVKVPFNDQTSTYSNSTVELPLDMSLIKSESLKTEADKTYESQPTVSSEYNEVQPSLLSHHKAKVTDADEALQTGHLSLSTGRYDIVNKGRSRQKDESNPSIPWQRRDMSRKEEYEFLEMNPFSDLAEFSLRYPHVHQRTYYRWKRRIKEEYIILEQCPDMTFVQFSSVVLQAKETVFNLWKGLIAQGKGFFAPSADASSKRVESKQSPAKLMNNFSAEYIYLQKNLLITQEQFCRKFPNISTDVFNVLKRKVMQEFWLFFQNKHMTWKEFFKILNVTEDVYNSWKEYAESMRSNNLPSDVKAALGDFPLSAPVLSSSFPSFLESPPLPADSNAHSVKDNMQNSVIDHFSSQTMPLDSALKNSVSRSLSAGYLTSLQNMMLPWTSYYNMPSPLGQQMLPMMLWPRMLGLTSGLVGPMNINSLVSATSSAISATNVDSSLDVLSNSSGEAFSSRVGKDDMKNDGDNFLSPKTDLRSSKLHGGKRTSSDSIRENDIVYENEGLKKHKFKEELDTGSSPYSRSRKQNKQEYIYYLKNPELCFKDLETLFPAISVRTFYRWRKEMNAAVLFIEDNKELNYQQFKLVFPDIPEDIFHGWKSKSGRIFTHKPEGHETESAAGETMYSIDKSYEFKDRKRTASSGDSDAYMTNYIELGPRGETEILNSVSFNKEDNTSGGGESSQLSKTCKESYLYVQQNPDVDFSVLIKMFPDVPAHTFYKWKKEWKDATDFLQANPDFDFEKYKSIDSSVSKEVFDVWKTSVCKGKFDGANDSFVSDESKRDFKSHGHSNRKHNGPEFVYLQLNPYIDFSQFNQTYSHVPSRTFYRWKREIQQILSYVRSQPAVTFADISAVLPDVSEEAFLKWKELIRHETETSEMKENTECLTGPTGQVDEEAKMRMTKALLHLMHNPNMSYSDFNQIFDFVSPETFQLWLHRIKLVVLHISSNPSLNYAEFSSAITDIGEDVFKKWKSLTPKEISSIGQDCHDSLSGTFEPPENTDNIKDALLYCQRNPDVSYDTFSSKYPSISQSQFKQWILKISDQIAFIKDNPGLTFEDFNKVFEDVSVIVFESWKEKPSGHYPSLNHVETEHDESNARLFDQDMNKSRKEVRDTYDSGLMSIKSEVVTSPQESSSSSLRDTEKENANESAESSLSKLTKFAESDVSLYTGWAPDNHPDQEHPENTSKVSKEFESSFSQIEKGQGLKPLYKSHEENDIDNNNVHYNGLHNSVLYASTKSRCNNLLNPLSIELNANNVHSGSPELHKSPLGHKEEEFGSGHKNSLPESKSLSALMVMSTNKSQSPFASPTFKPANINVTPIHCSNAGTWSTSQGAAKEDDEIFSSQRQKKMSRAEYLFVKDNPDVDSQEFARIFPGVSARTFYRWKKEIKAQIQIP